MLELSVYSHIVMSVPRNICDIDMTYVYSVYIYVTRRGMFVPHHWLKSLTHLCNE